ncbi:mono-functional DNA-alkylating methyl methanesulfonate N-term-domain-containing protein [Podospora australis]|uniref:DNA damage-binding protein 1 n=1 Tax=Podospora australis TaxID=1536484 RepID=A0AAN6WW31_9PEZI|nr:mono-functional DNA-alkylating methyl methanesulfonate N-term-domain-containing protein [Podospora australis]
MAYIAPIHRPSSVRHALQTNLLSPDEDCLVVSRTNRLEIWRLSEEGALSLFRSKPVNGTITILQKLRPKDHPLDLLLVGTDRFEYFTLAWNPLTNQLDTIKDPDREPGEQHMRDSQSQDRAIVDPLGRFVALHLWEGVLTILKLGSRRTNATNLEWLGQIRLSELFIKASTFLHSETGHPRIAFLYQSRADASADYKLATYRLTSDDKNTVPSEFNPDKHREIDIDVKDAGAAMLIPVRKVEDEVKRHHFRNVESAKAHLGGLIVVGETRLLYIDDQTKIQVQSPLKKANIFVAWAEYNATNYFLADDYGGLHLLSIDHSGMEVQKMEVVKLANTPRASELVYLPAQNLLFLASHYGHSQLFRADLLNPEPAQRMQLVQTLANIGPIMDFAVMDMGSTTRGGVGDGQQEEELGNEYSSGQARIVAGSGVYKDGSLKSVRSGVGLEDVGILAELPHTRRLFSLRSYGSQRTNTLVVSFFTETRVFQFDPQGEVEELESFAGLDLGVETLLAMELSNGQLLQVTPKAARLLDPESGVTISTWEPQGGDNNSIITHVSANNEAVLLSIGGTSLVSIAIRPNELHLNHQTAISEQDSVACLHVPPQIRGIGVVGFWSSGTVSIVDLQTLDPVHGETLRDGPDDASVPRDVVLVQVLPPSVSGPTLFIAMQDGYVVTFNVSLSTSELSSKKRVILGTQQARLHLLPPQQAEDFYSIFVTTEHPSLIYGEEGRIVYSATTANDATFICPFDSEAYPDSIIVASDSQIKISQIDRTRQAHIQDLPMGESVRRIAYSPKERVFGLGCIKREIIDGEEIVQSSFKLVDEVIFQRVGKEFPLETLSYTEIVETVIRAELTDSYGNPAERFLVGTSFAPDPDYAVNTDNRGRILVFGIDDNREPYLVLSHPLKGVCRCLAVMEGNLIVAGLSKTVVVAKYEETSTTTATLEMIRSFRTATCPVQIEVKGNIIGIADLMKSLTLVEYIPASTENKKTTPAALVEVAKHGHAVSATALCHIAGEDWLEADERGNLILLQRNPEGVTNEDKKALRITAEMNLGEMVNRIRGVQVKTGEGAMVVPRAFLGTVEGGIYLFGTIAPHAQDLLLRFQERLMTSKVVRTAGDIDIKGYRAFRNGERTGSEPLRFLDGEFLERFLDLDEGTQREVCEGLGPTVEGMRSMVEELRRMH